MVGKSQAKANVLERPDAFVPTSKNTRPPS